MVAEVKQKDLENEITSEGPDPVDVYVGKRLQAQRSLLGKSQEEVGDYLGLTFQQIQKYERGTNRIAASRLFRLGHFLKVLPNYFFDGLPTFSETHNLGFSDSKQIPLEGAPMTDDEVLRQRDVRELARIFNRITDASGREAVYNLAKFYADKSKT